MRFHIIFLNWGWMNSIQMLNTKIHNLSVQETLDEIERAISSERQLHHVVVNAGKIVAMKNDLQLRQSVNSCDVINADGQAVVWASRILGKPLKERVTGIDLMERLVAMAADKNYKIYFLGATGEIVGKVVETYSEKFGSHIIAGFRDGYFSENEEAKVALEIASTGPNILFVAISSPKKELFLARNKHLLSSVNFIMGVGGSFDVISGKVKRAPIWMQRMGLEWFYRFIQEPKRMWRRYLLGNATFIGMVLHEKFKY
jgi:N-acetylglucosaminyldiphosphoundecaprenol N-acetyl-beta-D-mannosaminyltransferase